LIGEELGRPVEVAHSYRNVLNAIVIEAEYAEAVRLPGVPGVVAVEPALAGDLAIWMVPALIEKANHRPPLSGRRTLSRPWRVGLHRCGQPVASDVDDVAGPRAAAQGG
jgi:hypothetical protein